jgi:hypothetical protein
VNVANGLSRLHGSFATLDVCQLVGCQVEIIDGYGFFDTPLIFFQHFGDPHWKVEFWGSIHNVPTVHGSQSISILNF